MNSQFPHIVKASAYPSTGPPSRPMSQEYLRRWEKCARENSYIVTHAAGFNHCTSELQERMTAHINLLSSRINKGKAPQRSFNDHFRVERSHCFSSECVGGNGHCPSALGGQSFCSGVQLNLVAQGLIP